MCDVHQPDARCGRPKKRYQIFLGCHQTGKDYDRVSDKVPAGLAVSLVGVLSKVSEYVYVVISQGTEAPLRWLTLWWRRVRVK